MNYLSHLFVYCCIGAVAALGLNLIAGHAGLLVLAAGAYFGIGAYAYAIVAMHSSSAIAGFVAAALAAALAGSALIWAANSFRNDTFAFVSLALQASVVSVIYAAGNSAFPQGSLRNLTNGPLGISGVIRPSMPFFSEPAVYHVLGVSLLLAAFSVSQRAVAAPWGAVLRAVRDDEIAAVSIGKKVRTTRAEAVVMGCTMMGIAGALSASYLGYVDPSTAGLDTSIAILTGVMVGGLASNAGAVTGAAIVTLLPEVLRFLDLPAEKAPALRLMAFGAMLLLLVHARPSGLMGKYGFR